MKKSKTIKKDLGKYKSIKVLAESEGGKHLASACLKDIISTVDMIAYTTKPLKLEEYIHLASKLSEKMSMYKVLTNAKKNAELTEEALKDALQEEAEE